MGFTSKRFIGSLGTASAIVGALVCASCSENGAKSAVFAPAAPSNSQEELICDASAIKPGPAFLRRLTHREYANTTRELLSATNNPATTFSPEEQSLGFDNNATVRSTSLLLVEQYEAAAHALAQKASKDLTRLLGCDPVTADENECVVNFLNTFGLRLFRRPLTSSEAKRYSEFYQKLRTDHTPDAAVHLMLAAMLQSAHFLYRMEEAPTAGADLDFVAPYSLASRLSYLLWQGPPDQLLLDAAAQGQLVNREQVRAQATRMLADPKARPALVDFYGQWFEFDVFERPVKDVTLFPRFAPSLGPLLRQESEAFVEHTLFAGPGDLRTLFTSSQTHLNDTLATFYGAPSPNSASLVPVNLPPTQRAGLLTQAGWLSAHASPTLGSPVARGFFVRDRILCQTPPPPPNDVNIQVPDYDPNLTTRARFAQHRESKTCSTCHSLMDPIGLGFENYDAVGLWREKEANAPVDATGELTGTDVDGPFNGAVELASRLGSSKTVADCAVTQWFRYAYGRLETKADACALRDLQNAFSASGGNLLELMVELTQTDTFLYRDVKEGATP